MFSTWSLIGTLAKARRSVSCQKSQVAKTMTIEKRIYVAFLAAYNNGELHGKWIDASCDVNFMQDDINAVLKASPISNAEEWTIHDL